MLFWALLYLLPAIATPLQGAGDLHVGAIEIWRRQWLAHGHTLRTSWLWGGGSLFAGMAPEAPWSPGVLLALVVGARPAALIWVWLQLSLAAGFAYGWLRELGIDHRGAATGALLGTCSLGPLAHAVHGQLTWAPLCWALALGWVFAASPRLGIAQLFGGTAGAACLLAAGAPHEAPVLAAPLLVWALWAARPRATALVAVVAGLVAASAIHLPLWLDAIEARALYDHAAVEAHAFAGMSWAERGVRGVLALVIPYVSAEGQADGNLLPLVPALLAVRLLPSRQLLGGLVMTLAAAPFVPPWSVPVLLGFHLARHGDRVPARAVRAGVIVAALLGGALSSVVLLRGLDERGPSLASSDGIAGVAVPEELYLFDEGYTSGVYESLRAGLVVHRPGGSFGLPDVDPRASGLVRSRGDWATFAQDGLLELEGPLPAGTPVVLSLRGDALVLRHVHSDEPVDFFETPSGWLAFTPREDLEQVRIVAR